MKYTKEWASFGACMGATIQRAREVSGRSKLECAGTMGWSLEAWEALERNADGCTLKDYLQVSVQLLGRTPVELLEDAGRLTLSRMKDAERVPARGRS